MSPEEALRFIRFIPRWDGKRGEFGVKGMWMAMGFRRVPNVVDGAVRIIVKKGAYTESIEWVKPGTFEAFQGRLRFSTACYAIRNFTKLNRWKRHRLPILIRFRRHQMVWNGTHRIFASQLLDKPLRCRVFTIGRGHGKKHFRHPAKRHRGRGGEAGVGVRSRR